MWSLSHYYHETVDPTAYNASHLSLHFFFLFLLSSQCSSEALSQRQPFRLYFHYRSTDYSLTSIHRLSHRIINGYTTAIPDSFVGISQNMYLEELISPLKSTDQFYRNSVQGIPLWTNSCNTTENESPAGLSPRILMPD